MIPLDRQVDILARLVERSRAYFDLYKFIEGSDYRPKIIDQMNEYLWFFRFQGHVLRYVLIVELGAIFERTNKSVCFQSVLERGKSRIHHVKHAELTQAFEATHLVSRKVSTLRNKAFAHRDSHLDFDDAFKKASITLDEIEALIEKAKTLADELCGEFKVQPPMFTTVETIEDCKRLFRQLGSEL
ncbi:MULTISPECIES: AbiU2 domain-containing protein [Hyphomonas]|uniref:AbiU2 domain-containing protein n=1 Tax=Hyphomonas TaxID=85 RepID=UPI00351256B2